MGEEDDVLVICSDSDEDECVIWKRKSSNNQYQKLWEKAKQVIFHHVLPEHKSTYFPYEQFKEFAIDLKNSLSLIHVESTKAFIWKNLIRWLISMKMCYEGISDLKYDERYNLILTDFMAQYVNYKCILYSKITEESEVMKGVNEILFNLGVVLGGNVPNILMTLLKIDVKDEYRLILEPIFRKYLSDKHLHEPIELISYLRLILCYRKWKKLTHTKIEKEQINEIAVGQSTKSLREESKTNCIIVDLCREAVLPKTVPEVNQNNQSFTTISVLIGHAIKKKAFGTRILLICDSLDLDKTILKFFQQYEEYISRSDSAICQPTNEKTILDDLADDSSVSKRIPKSKNLGKQIQSKSQNGSLLETGSTKSFINTNKVPQTDYTNQQGTKAVSQQLSTICDTLSISNNLSNISLSNSFKSKVENVKTRVILSVVIDDDDVNDQNVSSHKSQPEQPPSPLIISYIESLKERALVLGKQKQCAEIPVISVLSSSSDEETPIIKNNATLSRTRKIAQPRKTTKSRERIQTPTEIKEKPRSTTGEVSSTTVEAERFSVQHGTLLMGDGFSDISSDDDSFGDSQLFSNNSEVTSSTKEKLVSNSCDSSRNVVFSAYPCPQRRSTSPYSSGSLKKESNDVDIIKSTTDDSHSQTLSKCPQPLVKQKLTASISSIPESSCAADTIVMNNVNKITEKRVNDLEKSSDNNADIQDFLNDISNFLDDSQEKIFENKTDKTSSTKNEQISIANSSMNIHVKPTGHKIPSEPANCEFYSKEKDSDKMETPFQMSKQDKLDKINLSKTVSGKLSSTTLKFNKNQGMVSYEESTYSRASHSDNFQNDSVTECDDFPTHDDSESLDYSPISETDLDNLESPIYEPVSSIKGTFHSGTNSTPNRIDQYKTIKRFISENSGNGNHIDNIDKQSKFKETESKDTNLVKEPRKIGVEQVVTKDLTNGSKVDKNIINSITEDHQYCAPQKLNRSLSLSQKSSIQIQSIDILQLSTNLSDKNDNRTCPTSDSVENKLFVKDKAAANDKLVQNPVTTSENDSQFLTPENETTLLIDLVEDHSTIRDLSLPKCLDTKTEINESEFHSFGENTINTNKNQFEALNYEPAKHTITATEMHCKVEDETTNNSELPQVLAESSSEKHESHLEREQNDIVNYQQNIEETIPFESLEPSEYKSEMQVFIDDHSTVENTIFQDQNVIKVSENICNESFEINNVVEDQIVEMDIQSDGNSSSLIDFIKRLQETGTQLDLDLENSTNSTDDLANIQKLAQSLTCLKKDSTDIQCFDEDRVCSENKMFDTETDKNLGTAKAESKIQRLPEGETAFKFDRIQSDIQNLELGESLKVNSEQTSDVSASGDNLPHDQPAFICLEVTESVINSIGENVVENQQELEDVRIEQNILVTSDEVIPAPVLLATVEIFNNKSFVDDQDDTRTDIVKNQISLKAGENIVSSPEEFLESQNPAQQMDDTVLSTEKSLKNKSRTEFHRQVETDLTSFEAANIIQAKKAKLLDIKKDKFEDQSLSKEQTLNELHVRETIAVSTEDKPKNQKPEADQAAVDNDLIEDISTKVNTKPTTQFDITLKERTENEVLSKDSDASNDVIVQETNAVSTEDKPKNQKPDADQAAVHNDLIEDISTKVNTKPTTQFDITLKEITENEVPSKGSDASNDVIVQEINAVCTEDKPKNQKLRDDQAAVDDDLTENISTKVNTKPTTQFDITLKERTENEVPSKDSDASNDVIVQETIAVSQEDKPKNQKPDADQAAVYNNLTEDSSTKVNTKPITQFDIILMERTENEVLSKDSDASYNVKVVQDDSKQCDKTCADNLIITTKSQSPFEDETNFEGKEFPTEDHIKEYSAVQVMTPKEGTDSKSDITESQTAVQDANLEKNVPSLKSTEQKQDNIDSNLENNIFEEKTNVENPLKTAKTQNPEEELYKDVQSKTNETANEESQKPEENTCEANNASQLKIIKIEECYHGESLPQKYINEEKVSELDKKDSSEDIHQTELQTELTQKVVEDQTKTKVNEEQIVEDTQDKKSKNELSIIRKLIVRIRKSNLLQIENKEEEKPYCSGKFENTISSDSLREENAIEILVTNKSDEKASDKITETLFDNKTEEKASNKVARKVDVERRKKKLQKQNKLDAQKQTNVMNDTSLIFDKLKTKIINEGINKDKTDEEVEKKRSTSKNKNKTQEIQQTEASIHENFEESHENQHLKTEDKFVAEDHLKSKDNSFEISLSNIVFENRKCKERTKVQQSHKKISKKRLPQEENVGKEPQTLNLKQTRILDESLNKTEFEIDEKKSLYFKEENANKRRSLRKRIDTTTEGSTETSIQNRISKNEIHDPSVSETEKVISIKFESFEKQKETTQEQHKVQSTQESKQELKDVNKHSENISDENSKGTEDIAKISDKFSCDSSNKTETLKKEEIKGKINKSDKKVLLSEISKHKSPEDKDNQSHQDTTLKNELNKNSELSGCKKESSVERKGKSIENVKGSLKKTQKETNKKKNQISDQEIDEKTLILTSKVLESAKSSTGSSQTEGKSTLQSCIKEECDETSEETSEDNTIQLINRKKESATAEKVSQSNKSSVDNRKVRKKVKKEKRTQSLNSKRDDLNITTEIVPMIKKLDIKSLEEDEKHIKKIKQSTSINKVEHEQEIQNSTKGLKTKPQLSAEQKNKSLKKISNKLTKSTEKNEDVSNIELAQIPNQELHEKQHINRKKDQAEKHSEHLLLISDIKSVERDAVNNSNLILNELEPSVSQKNVDSQAETLQNVDKLQQTLSDPKCSRKNSNASYKIEETTHGADVIYLPDKLKTENKFEKKSLEELKSSTKKDTTDDVFDVLRKSEEYVDTVFNFEKLENERKQSDDDTSNSSTQVQIASEEEEFDNNSQHQISDIAVNYSTDLEITQITSQTSENLHNNPFDEDRGTPVMDEKNLDESESPKNSCISLNSIFPLPPKQLENKSPIKIRFKRKSQSDIDEEFQLNSEKKLPSANITNQTKSPIKMKTEIVMKSKVDEKSKSDDPDAIYAAEILTKMSKKGHEEKITENIHKVNQNPTPTRNVTQNSSSYETVWQQNKTQEILSILNNDVAKTECDSKYLSISYEIEQERRLSQDEMSKFYPVIQLTEGEPVKKRRGRPPKNTSKILNQNKYLALQNSWCNTPKKSSNECPKITESDTNVKPKRRLFGNDDIVRNEVTLQNNKETFLTDQFALQRNTKKRCVNNARSNSLSYAALNDAETFNKNHSQTLQTTNILKSESHEDIHTEIKINKQMKNTKQVRKLSKKGKKLSQKGAEKDLDKIEIQQSGIVEFLETSDKKDNIQNTEKIKIEHVEEVLDTKSDSNQGQQAKRVSKKETKSFQKGGEKKMSSGNIEIKQYDNLEIAENSEKKKDTKNAEKKIKETEEIPRKNDTNADTSQKLRSKLEIQNKQSKLEEKKESSQENINLKIESEKTTHGSNLTEETTICGKKKQFKCAKEQLGEIEEITLTTDESKSNKKLEKKAKKTRKKGLKFVRKDEEENIKLDNIDNQKHEKRELIKTFKMNEYTQNAEIKMDEINQESKDIQIKMEPSTSELEEAMSQEQINENIKSNKTTLESISNEQTIWDDKKKQSKSKQKNVSKTTLKKGLKLLQKDEEENIPSENIDNEKYEKRELVKTSKTNEYTQNAEIKMQENNPTQVSHREESSQESKDLEIKIEPSTSELEEAMSQEQTNIKSNKTTPDSISNEQTICDGRKKQSKSKQEKVQNEIKSNTKPTKKLLNTGDQQYNKIEFIETSKSKDLKSILKTSSTNKNKNHKAKKVVILEVDKNSTTVEEIEHNKEIRIYPKEGHTKVQEESDLKKEGNNPVNESESEESQPNAKRHKRKRKALKEKESPLKHEVSLITPVEHMEVKARDQNQAENNSKKVNKKEKKERNLDSQIQKTKEHADQNQKKEKKSKNLDSQNILQSTEVTTANPYLSDKNLKHINAEDNNVACLESQDSPKECVDHLKFANENKSSSSVNSKKIDSAKNEVTSLENLKNEIAIDDYKKEPDTSQSVSKKDSSKINITTNKITFTKKLTDQKSTEELAVENQSLLEKKSRKIDSDKNKITSSENLDKQKSVENPDQNKSQSEKDSKKTYSKKEKNVCSNSLDNKITTEEQTADAEENYSLLENNSRKTDSVKRKEVDCSENIKTQKVITEQLKDTDKHHQNLSKEDSTENDTRKIAEGSSENLDSRAIMKDTKFSQNNESSSEKNSRKADLVTNEVIVSEKTDIKKVKANGKEHITEKECCQNKNEEHVEVSNQNQSEVNKKMKNKESSMRDNLNTIETESISNEIELNSEHVEEKNNQITVEKRKRREDFDSNSTNKRAREESTILSIGSEISEITNKKGNKCSKTENVKKSKSLDSVEKSNQKGQSSSSLDEGDFSLAETFESKSSECVKNNKLSNPTEMYVEDQKIECADPTLKSPIVEEKSTEVVSEDHTQKVNLKQNDRNDLNSVEQIDSKTKKQSDYDDQSMVVDIIEEADIPGILSTQSIAGKTDFMDENIVNNLDIHKKTIKPKQSPQQDQKLSIESNLEADSNSGKKNKVKVDGIKKKKCEQKPEPMSISLPPTSLEINEVKIVAEDNLVPLQKNTVIEQKTTSTPTVEKEVKSYKTSDTVSTPGSIQAKKISRLTSIIDQDEPKIEGYQEQLKDTYSSLNVNNLEKQCIQSTNLECLENKTNVQNVVKKQDLEDGVVETTEIENEILGKESSVNQLTVSNSRKSNETPKVSFSEDPMSTSLASKKQHLEIKTEVNATTKELEDARMVEEQLRHLNLTFGVPVSESVPDDIFDDTENTDTNVFNLQFNKDFLTPAKSINSDDNHSEKFNEKPKNDDEEEKSIENESSKTKNDDEEEKSIDNESSKTKNDEPENSINNSNAAMDSWFLEEYYVEMQPNPQRKHLDQNQTIDTKSNNEEKKMKEDCLISGECGSRDDDTISELSTFVRNDDGNVTTSQLNNECFRAEGVPSVLLCGNDLFVNDSDTTNKILLPQIDFDILMEDDSAVLEESSQTVSPEIQPKVDEKLNTEESSQQLIIVPDNKRINVDSNEKEKKNNKTPKKTTIQKGVTQPDFKHTNNISELKSSAVLQEPTQTFSPEIQSNVDLKEKEKKNIKPKKPTIQKHDEKFFSRLTTQPTPFWTKKDVTKKGQEEDNISENKTDWKSTNQIKDETYFAPITKRRVSLKNPKIDNEPKTFCNTTQKTLTKTTAKTPTKITNESRKTTSDIFDRLKQQPPVNKCTNKSQNPSEKISTSKNLSLNLLTPNDICKNIETDNLDTNCTQLTSNPLIITEEMIPTITEEIILQTTEEIIPQTTEDIISDDIKTKKSDCLKTEPLKVIVLQSLKENQEILTTTRTTSQKSEETLAVAEAKINKKPSDTKTGNPHSSRKRIHETETQEVLDEGCPEKQPKLIKLSITPNLPLKRDQTTIEDNKPAKIPKLEKTSNDSTNDEKPKSSIFAGVRLYAPATTLKPPIVQKATLSHVLKSDPKKVESSIANNDSLKSSAGKPVGVYKLPIEKPRQRKSERIAILIAEIKKIDFDLEKLKNKLQSYGDFKKKSNYLMDLRKKKEEELKYIKESQSQRCNTHDDNEQRQLAAWGPKPASKESIMNYFQQWKKY